MKLAELLAGDPIHDLPRLMRLQRVPQVPLENPVPVVRRLALTVTINWYYFTADSLEHCPLFGKPAFQFFQVVAAIAV